MAKRTEPVTIYEVAARAGVSIATVSRVMRGSLPVSGPVRERVLDAVRELRYVPQGAASALAGGGRAALGLVLPHLEGAYYAQLLIGFETEASSLGLAVEVLLANPKTDAGAAVRQLAERVVGVAFAARSAAGDELLAELTGPRSVVAVARGVVADVSSINTENRDAMGQLVGHLLATGRTSFAFLGDPEPGSDLRERYAGFAETLRRGGCPVPEPIRCPLTEAGGVDAARRLLAGPLPDAVVCGNDLIALALMQALAKAGVTVPDQVAVTGWDDILAARYITPGLTTVTQPVEELGRLAARRLHEQVHGAAVPETQVLPTAVVHRGSCCTADSPRT